MAPEAEEFVDSMKVKYWHLSRLPACHPRLTVILVRHYVVLHEYIRALHVSHLVWMMAR